MIKKIFLLFLCLSFFPLFAQEDTDKSQNIKTSDISFEKNEELNSYKQLITELKFQKQNLEKENEQIQKALSISNQAFDRVTNAYWALFTIIITIVIFIFTGNIIVQHFDKKRIYKELSEEILKKCMEELNKFDIENKQRINNKFEEINRIVQNQTQEAITGIKKLQLERLKQELEIKKEEDRISSSMSTTLDIISLYFDLYGETNLYDDEIIDNFNYLKKCLKSGNNFWNHNHKNVNQLEKRCPKRLTREFNKVLELAEFDSNT